MFPPKDWMRTVRLKVFRIEVLCQFAFTGPNMNRRNFLRTAGVTAFAFRAIGRARADSPRTKKLEVTMVSPALERYTNGPVRGDLWKRPTCRPGTGAS